MNAAYRGLLLLGSGAHVRNTVGIVRLSPYSIVPNMHLGSTGAAKVLSHGQDTT